MSIPTIVGCQLELLSAKYEPHEIWSWPGGVYRGWTSAFIRLWDPDGHVGYGEIGDGLNVPQLLQPIVDRLATVVTGQSASPRAVLEALTRSGPGWGHGGVVQSVIGGFEMATFDLLGNALGVPARALLGGAVRETLPVYASGGLALDVDDLRDEMRRHVADGFDAVKMRIGNGKDVDRRRVEAAREELGPDRELMLDLGASYLPEPPDVREVVDLVRALEPMRPYWLEEPLPRDDVAGHAILRSEISTRIATAENERTPDHVRRLLDAQAVDVIQTDAVYVGGILRQLEIAALAESAGARLAPHTWCSGPGLMANATVVACAPAGLYLEVPSVPNRLRERTLVDPMAVSGGRVRLGDAPGLGVRFDDEVRGWSFDAGAGPVLHNARPAPGDSA